MRGGTPGLHVAVSIDTPAFPPTAPALPLVSDAQLFYALSVIILVSLLLAAWLALVLKKDDATQGGWIAK